MNSYEKMINIRKTKFASAAAVAAKLAEFIVKVKNFFCKYRSNIMHAGACKLRKRFLKEYGDGCNFNPQ